MEKSKEKGQWIHPSRVEIFKWLLRDRVSKLSIDVVKQRGKEKGENQGAHPNRVERSYLKVR